MASGTRVGHRVSCALALVLAAALLQMGLSEPAAGLPGSGGSSSTPDEKGNRLALDDPTPQAVIGSRCQTPSLRTHLPKLSEDDAADPGVQPQPAPAPCLVSLGVGRTEGVAGLWNPHYPTSRDRAPPDQRTCW